MGRCEEDKKNKKREKGNGVGRKGIILLQSPPSAQNVFLSTRSRFCSLRDPSRAFGYERIRNAWIFRIYQRYILYNWWNRELTLKYKLNCYVKPMKDPLGVKASKWNQGTTRGKEKILSLFGNRTRDLRIRSTVTLSTELRRRTEKVGDNLGGKSRRRESKGTYECCAT